MRLAILLVRDPLTHQDAHTALHVAEAALERGDYVEFFLLDAGVNLADARVDSDVHEKHRSLLERGLETTICQHNAEQRGVSGHLIPGVNAESSVKNGRIVQNSDRYISFT